MKIEGKVYGVEIRTTYVWPKEVIGIGDDTYVKYFWEGAEIAIVCWDEFDHKPKPEVSGTHYVYWAETQRRGCEE